MKRCSAVLLLFGAVGWSQSKGPRAFDLALPDNWKQAANLVLVFKDLEVPEDRSVVFRLFPAGQSEAIPAKNDSLASVSVVAKSRHAKGLRRIDKLEVNLSSEFRRWAEKAKPGERVSVVVKPYAGLREANDYPWQVRELKLEVR